MDNVYKLNTRSATTLVKESFSDEIIRYYNLREDGVLFITEIYLYMPYNCETIIREPEDDDFDIYYYQYKTLLEEAQTN